MLMENDGKGERPPKELEPTDHSYRVRSIRWLRYLWPIWVEDGEEGETVGSDAWRGWRCQGSENLRSL